MSKLHPYETLFKDVAIDQEFYDPFSGEFWIKRTATEAENLTGFEGFDTFGPEDVVVAPL